MDRLLNVTTGVSLVLLVIVLISVRRAHIRVEYSVSWLAAAVALLVLSRWRDLVENNAVDLLQMNVCIGGGFTAGLKVAALAQAFGVPIDTDRSGRGTRRL